MVSDIVLQYSDMIHIPQTSLSASGSFLIDGAITRNSYLQLVQQKIWPALQASVGDEEDLVVTSMMAPQHIMPGHM